MLHALTNDSLHQRHGSAEYKRTQDSSYATKGDCTQDPRLRNQPSNARSLPLANFGTFDHRIPHATEQQMAGSSGSSSFSQPATSGLHMESNPAQFFDSQSAYLLNYPTFNEMNGGNTGPRQDLEIDFSLNRGLIDGSGHNSLPASQHVQTPQELSWQQHNSLLFGNELSASADTAFGSYGLGLTANDRTWPSDLMHDPAIGFADHTLDHPGAIKIERSSGHYKSGLTSSFPPSADCSPDYMPTIQTSRPHRAITSTSQPALLSSSQPNLPIQKDSNKSTSVRGSRSGSLSVIREYGHPQRGSPILSRNGSVKGKRKGPLPTATAIAAARKRKDGSVCIRCRTMKMTCKGGLPCEGCRQITKAKMWDQSCTPANFIDMVKESTCNAVFQHSISHPALDGSRRLVVVPVPAVFNVSRLLDRLESCHSRYDIRVRHSSGSCYTLDSSNCFKLLTKMHKSYGLETCELQEFVKNKQLRSAWIQCIGGHDLPASVLDRSIRWNDMPSRNSYEVSPHNTLVLGHALDVEDQEDRGTIIFAVQLSRIILRALEIEAFEALQKSVNELTKGSKPDADIGTLTDQLGRILTSLRWRISWWAVVGDSPDERFISRVTKLSRVLYCYYFVARKKMSPWSGQLPNKIRSVYADVEPVYEELPLTDSLSAFHAWMQKGQAIVKAAKVHENIARSLPTASLNPQF